MHKSALKISLLIILFTVSAIASAQKTDIILLKNGDVFTGEIYYLKFAQLNFNMTSTGTINIKWEEVVRITSDKIFQVTLPHGEVYVTQLDSNFFEQHHTSINDIVEIIRIKDRFWSRLEGNVDLGFNYTKSNDILQFNFNSSTTHVKPKQEINLLLSSIISNQSSDSVISKNQNATFSILRQLEHNYYLTSSFGWQQNIQLGINNRFLLTAGGGKLLINDNHQVLLTGTGLSYNVEQSDESSNYTQNLEALFTARFKKFRYFTPKVSIDAQYTIYTGLTDWGRIRMNFNVSAKYEILKDFNVGLTFYDNFDNRPPAGAISKNDFGINFTLGYQFGR